ncbi:MAG: amino acid ABC transporter ATP-binding protein [Patescibacteria group bacterium]
MKPIIEIRNVYKSFTGLKVLNGISFAVNEGRVIGIIGPSGSGKTTLLRCINLLVELDSGEINIDNIQITKQTKDIDLRALREKVGMVFQQYNIWPHKTVLENIIEAPIVVKKINRTKAIKKSQLIIDKVGLSGKENDYPSTLSGGQQQRVAIARALAMEPKVLLLDEITSALDPELVGEVLSVVREIVKEHKQTILIVTHEMGFARDIADEIIFIDHGKIVEQGPPARIFQNPKHKRTKKFLERILSYKL